MTFAVDHHDGKIRIFAADPPENLDSVDAGQRIVEQCASDRVPVYGVQAALAAVLFQYAQAFAESAPEGPAAERAISRIVVDDQEGECRIGTPWLDLESRVSRVGTTHR